MSDIHYIPDSQLDQAAMDSNQIPPNSTSNGRGKVWFRMPLFQARKAKKPVINKKRPTKTLDQLMRRYQEHVDANALILFPVAFLFFNVSYWVHYLIFRQQT